MAKKAKALDEEVINMDVRTGVIGPAREMERTTPHEFLKPINLNNLSPQVRKMVEKTGRGYITRNSRCPCGSGKRFKKCCMIEL